MSSNFCNYIKTDNWKGLKKEVNAFLVTIRPEDGTEINFKKINDWISAQDCVTKVSMQPGEMRTYPPIKQFAIELKDNGGSLSKTLGISFTDKKYAVNIQ